MRTLIVKYHSSRMFTTVDVGQLFSSLFDKFGEVDVRFMPMSSIEVDAVTYEVQGIVAVRERFWIFDSAGSELVRLEELEKEIIRLGQK